MTHPLAPDDLVFWLRKYAHHAQIKGAPAPEWLLTEAADWIQKMQVILDDLAASHRLGG